MSSSFFFNWGIVDLQYCVSFRCMAVLFLVSLSSLGSNDTTFFLPCSTLSNPSLMSIVDTLSSYTLPDLEFSRFYPWLLLTPPSPLPSDLTHKKNLNYTYNWCWRLMFSAAHTLSWTLHLYIRLSAWTTPSSCSRRSQIQHVKKWIQLPSSFPLAQSHPHFGKDATIYLDLSFQAPCKFCQF